LDKGAGRYKDTGLQYLRLRGVVKFSREFMAFLRAEEKGA
jgi:hypothetical protein